MKHCSTKAIDGINFGVIVVKYLHAKNTIRQSHRELEYISENVKEKLAVITC